MKKDFGVGDFNRLYKEFSPYFSVGIPGFHNLLWQVQMNQTLGSNSARTWNKKTQRVAFTANYVIGGLELSIAHESGGYTSTGVFFEGAISYDKGCEVCEQLNLLVFGLNKMAAYSLITKSMRRKKP